MNKFLPQEISKLRAFSQKANTDTIHMGLGKPFEDMPVLLRNLAKEILENRSLKMDYTENGGLLPVRTLLESHYRLRPGSLLLSHGAQEGIFASLFALLNAGDEVLLPNPGFVGYAPIVQGLGAKAVFYPLASSKTGFEYSIDLIEKKVSRKTKVILINAPANPTGTTATAEFVLELAKRFPKLKILSDEVYGELHFLDPYIPFCRYAKNIISINAFSKSHALTGWRIGWVGCEDTKIMQKILVAHQYIATCASVPAQHLIGALLSDQHPGLFDQIRDAYCAAYLVRRDEFFRGLDPELRNRTAVPEAGFYAFLPIPKKFSSSLKFAEKLLEKKNVLVTPGEFFGSLGKRYVRISYATSIENIKLACERIHDLYS